MEFNFSADQWEEIILAWCLEWNWPDYVSEEQDEVLYDYLKSNLKCVDENEEIEHKLVINDFVYHLQPQNLYFRVTQVSDNCGYWGDGENYPPEIEQVEPYEVKVTKYKTIHKKGKE